MLIRSLSGIVILAFLALDTAALADPPTVRIEQQATLLAPAAVDVIVAVTCVDGPTKATVVVNVRQGDSEGEGQMTDDSDGTRQEVSVLVLGGPFSPGEASASAVLICGTAQPAGLDLGALIKISEASEPTLP
jgi:hypothetical protein